MPAVDDTARRSVVPAAAGRSLWLSALWTGAGTALVASVVGVVAVSVLWLPAAGQAGNAGSAVRAGVLTFLAGLHGGVTVDGLDANFLPLGLLGIVALLARRAGMGLADAAAELEIDDPRPLWRALALQAGAFAVVCGLLALLTPLGTSSVPVVGAVLAGLVLFGLAGGGFFVRETPALADQVAEVVPHRFRRAGRVAVAVLAVQLAAGTLLAAASVVLHHDRVEALSRQLGGGWSGVPVLLLGVLAAPNAAVAGASYLSGAGFAVGDGTAVSLGSTPHGTLPAFPILGALPTGTASWAAWVLAGLMPLAAGGCAAALVQGSGSWRARWRDLALGLGATALLAAVVAWQAGGSIGSGRLHAVGASPWQFGLAAAVGSGAVASVLLALQWAGDRLRVRTDADPEFVPLAGLGSSVSSSVRASVSTAAASARSLVGVRDDEQERDNDEDADEDGKGGKLAG